MTSRLVTGDVREREKALDKRDRELCQLQLAGAAVHILELMNSKAAMTCIDMLKKQIRRHLIEVDKQAAILGIPHPNPVTRPLR